MNNTEAYSLYKEFSEYIGKNSGSPDILETTPPSGMTMVQNWHDSFDEEHNNHFDRMLTSIFGEGQNDTADICTVNYKGVHMNVWSRAGLLAVGCPYGFEDEDGWFHLLYAESQAGNTAPGKEIGCSVDDSLFWDKLKDTGIYSDGDRWYIKLDAGIRSNRSLLSLIRENGLQAEIQAVGLTVAELHKNEYRHLG